MTTYGYKFTTPVAERNIKRILEALQKPMTCRELAEAVSLHRATCQSYLAFLMTPGSRRVRIYDWRPNEPGSPSPVYAAGFARDAPKPPKRPRAEIMRKWREKPGVSDRLAAKRKAAKIKPYRDPLTEAMFGTGCKP